MKNKLYLASTVTLVGTLILFILALFLKGFTHDLLLEAGVFLVSIKLVIASQKTHMAEQVYMDRLARIQEALSRLEAKENPREPG